MINDPDHLVPDKTIAVIPLEGFNLSDLSDFIMPLRGLHKRDWFDKGFYKCLPLAIGNTYGFVVYLPFDLEVIWTGHADKESLTMQAHGDEPYTYVPNVSVASHFGFGILTISIPVILKTPPKVNLMTIAPPNYILWGLSPMTGVVEADNLQHTFTFNIRLNVINQVIFIPKRTPLVGLLPIPRYFADEFELVDASTIFDADLVNAEEAMTCEHTKVRQALIDRGDGKTHDMSYYNGTNIKGQRFLDHQVPKR